MSGTAVATFTCGAEYPRTLRDWARTGQYKVVDWPCDNIAILDLVNDGQYTNFNQPEGWHIELGVFDAAQTIVRCPEHCKWVGSTSDFMTGEEMPAHWEDT